MDNWINGYSIKILAPNLGEAVPCRTRSSRSVRQALTNRTWVKDIKCAMTVHVLLQYLHIWGLVRNVVLDPMTSDHFIWKWTSSGESVSYTHLDVYKRQLQCICTL
ncbi:hypothetical protein BAE44_0016405 [Dichanthelium oligosanthes]|uniref:Uncharacterized protein n=1 Tax=Dichanthelium oligosanthes TaxID=888268 RepID=A0A1E5VBY5_9POAL|nr:hypothetical protein BAE44_0016405 [Dichanthelium oligosanthes]